MFPVAFEEENMLLEGPLTNPHLEPLPIHRINLKNGSCLSFACFKITQEELDEIIRTKKVWFMFVGPNVPIISLMGCKPQAISQKAPGGNTDDCQGK